MRVINRRKKGGVTLNRRLLVAIILLAAKSYQNIVGFFFHKIQTLERCNSENLGNKYILISCSILNITILQKH